MDYKTAMTQYEFVVTKSRSYSLICTIENDTVFVLTSTKYRCIKDELLFRSQTPQNLECELILLFKHH